MKNLLLEKMLLEHNVVNLNDIKRYCERFATKCDSELAQEWFRKVLYKFLVKNDDINIPMTDETKPRITPDWMDAAIERGDDLRVFHAPEDLESKMDHLVDFFNHMHDNNDPTLERMRGGNGVRHIYSVEEAVTASENWVTSMAKEAEGMEADKGVKTIMQIGAFRWVEATDNIEVVHRDGKIIQNCLGQGYYDRQINDGTARIFFLRNNKNQPHVACSLRATGQDGWKLGEIKGKQNQPPVGRYVRMSKLFLNKMAEQGVEIAGSGGTNDVTRMGLNISDEGKVGDITDIGETVSSFNGGVDVIKMGGSETKEVRDMYGYGGRRNQTRRVEENVTKFHFYKNGLGDLVIVTLEKNGKIKVGDCEEEVRQLVKPMVKKFLNEYFDEVPQPVTGFQSSNKMESMGLDFDYNRSIYGDPKSDMDTVYEDGDFKVKTWGTGSNTIDYKFFDGDHVIGSMRTDQGKYEELRGAPDENGRKADLPDKRYAKQINKALNHLDMKPKNSRRHDSGFDALGINYNHNTGQHGSVSKIGELIHQGDDGINLYYWREHEKSEEDREYENRGFSSRERRNPDDHELFTFMKRGKRIFEIRHNGHSYHLNDISSYDEGDFEHLGKYLADALNTTDRFKEVDWSKVSYDFDRVNVYYHNGVWGQMKDVSEKVLEFPNGAYFTKATRGSDAIYVLKKDNNEYIYIETVRGAPSKVSVKDKKKHPVLGKYVLELFNQENVREMDTANASDGGYHDDPSSGNILFTMGLFHDKRTDKWKMIQSGRKIYKGDGFNVVNFRNRAFFVRSEDDAIVGEFKKDGYTITELKPHGIEQKELLKYVGEYTRNSEMVLPQYGRSFNDDGVLRYSTEYDYKKDLRDHGHSVDSQGNPVNLEDVYPTKTILKSGRGWEWRREIDTDEGLFSSGDHESAVHGNKYSLISPKGVTEMRVHLDDDNFVTNVDYSYKYKDHWNENKTVRDKGSLNKIEPEHIKPYINYLVDLFNKLDAKLSATHLTRLGIYRAADGYKKIGSNKALKGFIDGKIEFPDGHVLKRETEKRWELKIENPNPRGHYDKWLTMVEIEIDDDGIESMKFANKKVKRRPHDYMPYINKLVSAMHVLSGDDE